MEVGDLLFRIQLSYRFDKLFIMEKHLAEIILFDDKKQILLQHRTNDAPTFPGMYCIFGGNIESKEDPKAAVKRECLEELGYELSDPRLILEITVESVLGKRVKYIFSELYDPSKELILKEGQGMIWVSEDSYREFDVIDHDLVVLEKIFIEKLL